MKSSQINIRFSPQIEADLNAICEKMGTSKSSLVRKLTEVFISDVKRSGSLTLDHRWIRELGQADGRSEWGSRKIIETEEQKESTVPTKKEPNE